jgi:hypothetical protein
MVDLAFRNSQAANVTTVVRSGLSADDSIATLELAIDEVRLVSRQLPWHGICADVRDAPHCGRRRSWPWLLGRQVG